MAQDPFDVNIQTSVRTLASMVKFPSNQAEYFLDTTSFQNRNLSTGHKALFLLEQELLYAQNIRSNYIVNPAAILGTIPYSGGKIPTAIDYQMIPGFDAAAVDKIGGMLGRGLAAKQGWNLGQLEDNFERSASPIDQVRSSITNAVTKLLGISTESSDPGTKKGKSIEDYLSVNDVNPIPRMFTAPRDSYFNDNASIASNDDVEEIIPGLQFPFYFKSLNYSQDSDQLYIFFQGIINSLTETYSPNWNSEEVFGRPHPLWIYSNVNRSIGIDFTIISKNFNDLDKVRQRANWLSKHTYPTLATAKGDIAHFKSGPLISITIGNLFQDLNGFISSLEFDWNALQRWELAENSVFPQGLKVNIRFNVLEKELIRNSDEEIFDIYQPFDNSILNNANNPQKLDVTSINQLVKPEPRFNIKAIELTKVTGTGETIPKTMTPFGADQSRNMLARANNPQLLDVTNAGNLINPQLVSKAYQGTNLRSLLGGY